MSYNSNRIMPAPHYQCFKQAETLQQQEIMLLIEKCKMKKEDSSCMLKDTAKLQVFVCAEIQNGCPPEPSANH